MQRIDIELGNSNVAKDDKDLFALLRGKTKWTSVFREAIADFLDDFNKKYDTNVSFAQVLNIYRNKSALTMEESIILCKALLDFIQNNWIEITFQWKKHLLRYETLANTNVALEFNPMSDNEMKILNSLSFAISSFINEVRKYFRILLPDGTSLSEASIDSEFSKIPGMKREKEEVELANWEKARTAPWSVKIAPNFIINCEISDDDLKLKITKFTNQQLQKFLNYIYDRMPSSTEKKHIHLAKCLFENYNAAAWQTIRRGLEGDSKIRMATMNKINIRKLKKFLFSDVVDLPQEQSVEAVTNQDIITENEVEPQDFSVYMKDELLYISELVSIDLSDDETFQLSLTKLSRENAQKFFWLLEEIVIKKYDITQRYSAAKIYDLIQKSTDPKVETNVRQKVTSLRTKPSLITDKFLNNNINISNLRQVISEDWVYLEKSEVEEDSFEPENKGIDDLKVKGKKFIFEFPEDDSEEQISLEVGFDWKKNLEWFIGALNSLISQESERQKVWWIINPLSVNDFKEIKLDSAFFDNINRQIEDRNILDMFWILEQKDLEFFLSAWHRAVWKKMVISKKVYVESWSKEELWDFVFNVWQKKIDTKVRKEIRTGTTRVGKADKKREDTRLTKNMFDWVDSLTVDLIAKLSPKKFSKIFDRVSKKDLKLLIEEYLDSRVA